MSGMLEGIKVIDMGQVVAVPATGAILGDMGAEVIKLEPLTGEVQRGQRRVQGVETTRVNGLFQVLNRNKRGLAVNLKTDAGREILYKLVRSADVFMSNYELSAIKNLKLDYPVLSQINPRLIYATMNGYGYAGPDREERGYDYAAGWARAGIMHMIGEPGSVPVSPRPGMMDNVTGTHLATGILAALLHRERTGKGQELETSLYHCGVWTLSIDTQMALGGQVAGKKSRTEANNPLFNSYKTKDERWIWLAMLSPDPSWPAFCKSISKPELETDSRFESMDKRSQNCTALVRIIEDVMVTKTEAEWETTFRKFNVIYGRVLSPNEVVNDPQAIANDFFPEVEHPTAGKMRLVSTPITFCQNPSSIRTTAPEVGQHTEEILLEAGYTWDDLSRFKEAGAIL